MSMTKRYLDSLNESDSPSHCFDCRVDWDIKGYKLCERHAEEQARVEDAERYAEFYEFEAEIDSLV